VGDSLTATELLTLYAHGSFPMAEQAFDEEFLIVTPKKRALLPIQNLHISKSLRKLVRRAPFEIRTDYDFSAVIAACAEARPDRPETWINASIQSLFLELHQMGFAHSIECWQDEKLVGGLYGLALGGTFCGESMFSRVPNASKIALVHLCARLAASGFSVLDVQFSNPHLEQFGLYEIPQEEYVRLLHSHLGDRISWLAEP
jgi:leucyl/phenylalanyl-tRNA--protein transferase